ncbi:MAG: glutamate--tRNA ligase [Chloroflexota bacterium]
MSETKNPKDSQPARVRIAPSPTGMVHIGTARTALYNYLLAHQTGGQFILRLEDTDQKRYDPDSEEDIINSLKWLGIQWDEGPDIGGPYSPYRQTERKEIYQQHAQDLIEKGHAFTCFCTREELGASREKQQKQGLQPKYAGPCRNHTREEVAARVSAGEAHVIRFKMPKEGTITVTDRLRGEIIFENKNLDDYIIVKSDGLALYHLAAMVDDHLMKITHVFRGEEWIPTFPLHVHIYRAFGWEEPEWVHLSLFLKPSGKGKMSKRDSEAMKLAGDSIFVKDMPGLGYLPEAVNNWTALMGWSYDGETEFFTMDDMIEKFSVEKLNPSNAAIDFKKFDHFNGLHIRSLSVEELTARLVPYFESAGIQATPEEIALIAPIIQERMITLDDGPAMASFFFKDEVIPVPEELIAKKMTAKESLQAAKRGLEVLQSLDEFTHDSTEPPMRALVEELGIKAGQLFGIFRVAVTGQKVSPPLFESMEIVGKETVLARTLQAVAMLETLAQAEN